MHTTALKFPVTASPWEKPTAVIRGLRRPRPEVSRLSSAALNRPQSKWTVVAAFVLSVFLHVAPVVYVEMKLDAPPIQTTQAVTSNPIPTTAD